MGLPCCGMVGETGSLVIAFLQMLENGVALALLLIAAAMDVQIVTQMDGSFSFQTSSPRKVNLCLQLAFKTTIGFCVVFATIGVVTSLFLVYGILKKKKFFITPWLVAGAVRLVFLFSIVITVCLTFPQSNILLASYLGYAAVQTFFWAYIITFHAALRKSKRKEAFYKNLALANSQILLTA